MTFETIFRNVLGPSTSPSYHRLSSGEFPRYPAEKDGAPSDYHHFGYHKKLKGKSKSDKKQAVLSALTLLAFLFFLNVLQSCIREQNQTRGAVAMFGPTAATAPTAPTAPNSQQSKAPDRGRPSKSASNASRLKRNVLDTEEIGRKNLRSLLGLPPSGTRESEKRNFGAVRRLKFIRDLESVKNWTTRLSPMTDQDLKNQKAKTLNYPLLWKNHIPVSDKTFSLSELPPAFTEKTIRSIDHPLASADKISQGMKVVEQKENISNAPNSRVILPAFTTTYNRKLQKAETQNKVSPFFQKHLGYRNSNRKTFQKGNPERQTQRRIIRRVLKESATNTFFPKNVSFVQGASTPRSRHPDHASTPKPIAYEDYEEPGDQVREPSRFPPTPAVGLDLNTFQTFPVYNYYNHRPYVEKYGVNQTTGGEILKKQENLDRVHEEIPKDAVEPPLFYPTKSTPLANSPFPHHENSKHWQRHPSRQGNFPTRYRHPPGFWFGYSPYRKVSAHEAPQFQDDYFGPLVLARYPQEDSAFDFAKLFWTALESFAKPLTKLVPPFAKENNEEPQCYDLLLCEAQRVSKFIGPTAEALAATVGTLLTWASSEETRQEVEDAISAGRVNTCQQQIKACENRSGGKSALTVIAQVMELKLR